MMTPRFPRLLLTAALLFTFAGSAHAQGMGSIFGKATDSSGAVMPGVTVTVTGTGLQQPRTTVTGSSGAYQMPNVPIGTYTVTFELNGFKKVTRPNVIVNDNFNAQIDTKMEIGQMSDEVTVSGASPVVDIKKTTTGAVFDAAILQNIPTARDPWQIINMTPGVQAGLNVGGSSSGQQVGLESRGTTADVQWNLEGGSITDLSSNSSPSYFNFDAFEQIQVTNGGGDVSVQSSGLFINLITKSGSNVFKGSAVGTFENDSTQFSNVTEELFNAGTGGFLSGNPLKKISNVSIEYGGPILKNRLWFWGAADHQDINVGVLNFFDPGAGANCATYAEAQRLGNDLGIGFGDLETVQKCLKTDNTTIKTWSAKFNYQLSSAHRFQYLMQADDKVRNARGSSATTAIEAASQQYGGSKLWDKITPPTISATHTWVANDRLVFNNQYTYVPGGFSLDYQDYKTCGESNYIDGATDPAAYRTGPRADPNCLWNQQHLRIRTTGFQSRSKLSTYQTTRISHELKTDGTYFATGVLGGDHSLKFGVGYRKAPIQSFSHYSGGGRAWLQCMNNNSNLCGDGSRVAPGSGQAGFVPYRAELYRDQLRNNDWWTYFGYIQDSFSRGKWRVNGGLRYDWQQSKYLGGCVAANIVRPDLLPAQCEEATQSGINPNTGETETIQPFANWAPRLSVTYDLFGNGKTALKAAGSYYFDTRQTLANALGGLFTVTRLQWTNNSSGTCPSARCWTDANGDGVIQANELLGTPVTSSSRFDPATGILRPAGNLVDKDTKLFRTREAIVGISHELIPNLAAGVDYIYRKYDRGLQDFTIGYQPGAPGYPLTNIYTGPLTHTDTASGISAPYYVVTNGLARPSGLGTITVTDPDSEDYHGVDFTVNKRYSDKWQLSAALTVQTNPNHILKGSINPTGDEFLEGASTIAKYVFKMNGSYQFPWGVMASANFNMNHGAVRQTAVVIDGPGDVYGGTTGQISYDTLQFQARDEFRYDPAPLLDLGVHKTFALGSSEKYRFKLMLDMFNILNTNTIIDYSSDNFSQASFSAPSAIVPPRVFRIGGTINF
ncbi:MAG: carboxypeptidase regulatory-like domain-containing protein [Acidobacteria bacterium]|nr:carboxypeptidase regulatory-like domain-containing protein [Acidobacteriota bacterium]